MNSLFFWIIIAFATWGVLKLFEIPVSFNLTASFLPGEKVLFSKRWIWAALADSPPTYRVVFSAPPFMEQCFYITDRRVLHVFYLFRIFKTEESQWFRGMQKPGDSEFVKEVICGKSTLFGPYLDIISENLLEKRWYRSPKLRIRLFMKNPEFVLKIINEAMVKPLS